MSHAELIDKIKGMLGGRAAEEVVFAEITTGAENDLEHATALARQMVCMYGMSESVGLVSLRPTHEPLPGVSPGTARCNAIAANRRPVKSMKR